MSYFLRLASHGSEGGELVLDLACEAASQEYISLRRRVLTSTAFYITDRFSQQKSLHFIRMVAILIRLVIA